MSGIPIRFWSKAEEWQRWEINCFRMLNGDRFRAFTSGTRTVCFDKMHGKSLWEHLNEGTLTRRMLEAAGAELRRAHQFWSDEFDGPWSHGDSTTTNVIYNQKTGRARLIDFEIVHDRSLPAKSRHADDLLVFLLDVIAIPSSRQWLPFAVSFLNAYGRSSCYCRIDKSSGSSGGSHGFGGGPYQLHQSGESKTASRTDSRCHR
jgi:hypothetical protein